MKQWLLLLLLAGNAHAAITIGAGPALTPTDKRGTTWYQEFQDWTASDLRALDTNNDDYKFNDGNDTSRDLTAFYSRIEGDYIYFRADLFDLGYCGPNSGAENCAVDLYVAIDCASGGQVWLPDFTDSQTWNPWEICVAVYNSTSGNIYDQNWATHPNDWAPGQNGIKAYWRSDLDSVEFGIKKQLLLDQGWNGDPATLQFQVFTTRDGTQGGAGEIPNGSDVVDTIACPGCGSGVVRDRGDGNGTLTASISATSTVNRAKYAAIMHANQSIAARSGTQDHILRDNGTLTPGFVRAIDTHEMLGAPLNMHLSGSLISSLLWARQNPAETTGVTAFPGRDGPTFLNRLKNFIQSGKGSLIGGVYAEHIMPYFEGEANRASIRAFNDLAESFFGLTTNDMKVLHVPERVFHSNTNWFKADPSKPLKGQPFEDIKAGGYVATYLDEVTHLHWWFYPNETTPGFFYPGFTDAQWDDNNWGRWAGGEGNDEARYHHKLHKINGVLTFMINDKEDQEKFGNNDSGMRNETRYSLLQKALSPDYAQITIVFDDWEAYAGNSFGQGANNNADQWHNTIRWAANHQWIQIVNLKDVVAWAQSDTNWVVDHGYVYDKTLQTYEWLKKASEHSYDNWYYGYTGNGVVEENFANRAPAAAPSGWKFGTEKVYGDMNSPGTLIRDSWDKVAGMPAGKLKTLAEWTYSAMIFETAWHDENAPAGWSGGNWFDAYKSKNYQITFERPEAGSYEDKNSNDPTSDWALRLHGHVRKVGIHADAAQWAQAVKLGSFGTSTIVTNFDVDDDLWSEYILKNDKVYLCFKRWGGRLLYAFAYDPVQQDALQVIGVPGANPSQEHDGEGADSNRCSGFKDRYVTNGGNNYRYVDDDYALTAPILGSNFVEFVSTDGAIRKRFTLPFGRDAVRANYTVGAGAGTVYIRHGFGPNQLDLMKTGDANLRIYSDSFYYGLVNTNAGGAVFCVNGAGSARESHTDTLNLSNAGFQNRELPLVQQVEQYNTATNASLWLAFSLGTAQDIDGDGIPNDQETGFYENPDRDNDGMSDGFELTYFLSPTAGDPNADDDGDGMKNIEEFVAGTSPKDAGSQFRILSIVPDTASTYRITWSSVAGKRYQVWYRDGLTSNNWSLTVPDSILATGTNTSYITGSGYPERYYKVQVLPPP